MKTNRRWLTSVFATTRKPLPALPWQSSVRNYVPTLAPAMIPGAVAAYAARPQASAAR